MTDPDWNFFDEYFPEFDPKEPDYPIAGGSQNGRRRINWNSARGREQ